MRILVVTGTYVPVAGGSEYSLHETLEYLHERGHELKVITKPVARRKSGHKRWVVPCESKQVLEQTVCEVNAAYRPDMVFTQLLWSDYVLKNRSKYGWKVVYFARNTGSKLNLTPGHEEAPDLVVANSGDTRDFLDDKWGCRCLVLRPVVRDSRFQPVRSEEKRTLHFMTNPNTWKGGEVFLEIARRMPTLKFATVYGWEQFRQGETPDDDWNPVAIRELEAALGRQNIKMPKFARFDTVENVEILPITDNIEQLFAEIRVILLPSQWREALSRIVVEAAACGVPSIVSDVGGVREGPINEKYMGSKDADIAEWVKRIELLQDENEWQAASDHVLRQYYEYRKRNEHELEELHARLRGLAAHRD